jgi:hypothetical protein
VLLARAEDSKLIRRWNIGRVAMVSVGEWFLDQSGECNRNLNLNQFLFVFVYLINDSVFVCRVWYAC